MQKMVVLSSLAVLLFASTLYAETQHRKLVKTPKYHTAKKVYRPAKHKVVQHTDKKHIHPNRYRPKATIVKHYRPGHRVKRLQSNAFHFVLGGLTYHYVSGVFYRPYHSGYTVVHAPVGALVYTLPHGYTKVYINNRHYYHYNDVYYSWDRRRKGYCVVDVPSTYCASTASYNVPHYHYQLGDIAHNLPAGAVRVVIDGRHYWEAEGVYFKSKKRNGRIIYKVVKGY
ncbi:MAG: hypothetical protein K0U47_01310 [Epsilonproteobacteria bacterium]|nr:hypothetical protein [Campylobacterota bacterium]